MDQMYKLFSNFQNSNQTSTNFSSTSLVYKDNVSSSLVTTSKTKISWILDSNTSDYMIDAYYLFTTYSPYIENFEVRIENESLSSMFG